MKRLLSLILILTLTQMACKALFPSTVTPTPGSISDPMTIPWEERELFSPGLVTAARDVLKQMPDATVYHIQIELDADMTELKGREEVRYTNTEDVALQDVRLRLYPNLLGGEMHIPEVQVDGQPITPNYTLDDSLLTVPLAAPLQPDSSVTLGMDFTVTIPTSLDLNYGVLAYAGGVLALAHAYPMIPVYNEEGWNAEVPPESGDLTFGDMSFFVVSVTAPRDLQIVAVGRELGREDNGSTQTVVFAAGPVRDFYLTASRSYRVVTGEVGETTVRFYAADELRNGAREGLEAALRSVETFNSRYALYPYSELDLAATPTLALGIEYPGMIAITSRILEPGNYYLEGTVAHEVGHQWFYNLVGNDQLDHPWLDESLTQFATLQYFSDQYGSAGLNGYRQSMEDRWAGIGNAPIPIGLPVSGYTDQEYGAIVYGRGGLFFLALRQEIGEQAFDAFMTDYASTYSWDIATPEGLQSLAEEHCSCDLDALFEEWVYP